MSSADYMRGFVAGARAARHGTAELKRALDRYWLYYSGYVLMPGETTITRKSLDEWQIIRDDLTQQITGHNRLTEDA